MSKSCKPKGFLPKPSHLLVLEKFQYDARTSLQLRNPSPKRLPFDVFEFHSDFADKLSPSDLSELTFQPESIPLSHSEF
jgi:hypothetical protein